MPEFRQNMLTKEWVIIATERARRPEEFKARAEAEGRTPSPRYVETCPFCAGHEDRTPPQSHVVERDGRWLVRVVPNKFAALQDSLYSQRQHVGRFLKVEGYGIAEIVIETPRHDLNLATLPEDHVQEIVDTYRSRYLELAGRDRIALVTVFRNHGSRAGTSLEHPHSQIIATPIVPPEFRDQLFKSQVSTDTYGSCVYCEVLSEEIAQEVRVVELTDNFVVVCPFASAMPFEMRIYPRRHASSFGAITDAEVGDLARVLRRSLLRLYIGLGDPDYNFVVHSAPTDQPEVKFYHWYIIIRPRLTTPAGFEMGTGIYINTALPERCAEFLRTIDVHQDQTSMDFDC